MNTNSLLGNALKGSITNKMKGAQSTLRNMTLIGGDGSDGDYGSSGNVTSEEEQEDTNSSSKRTPHVDFATLRSEMGVTQSSHADTLTTIRGKNPIKQTTKGFLEAMHKEFNEDLLRQIPFDRAQYQ